MENKNELRSVDLGYSILIILLLIEQSAIFIHLYIKQSYSAWDFAASLGALIAILFGFTVRLGISVVIVFLFIVTYIVWLATSGRSDVLDLTWLLFIPANVLITSFIKNRIVRTKRIMERLEDLKQTNPAIDLDTGLGNKESFNDTLIKQANLARRYSDKYDFAMALFKIEFLPLVLESLGQGRYSKFLLEISNTIQKQIRHEDYKFSIDMGRFIVLCPLTDRDFFPVVTDRIKNAMMNLGIEDKNGQPLKLVVKSSIHEFDIEQFELYRKVDDVIAMLERDTEIDLVAEYV